MSILRNIVRGMLIGITDLVPGVSGGTIALLLGIYSRLIAAINGFFSRAWKEHIGFLITLGTGIIISLFVFSGLIEWLLEYHSQPTFYFFMGLIVGILPILLNTIQFKSSFKLNHYLLIVVGAILIASTAFFREDGIGIVMTNLTIGDYIFLFFAGWLGSTAMILPGISGSFMLMLIGVYPTVINALSDLRVAVIMVVGMGVAIGMIIMSKFVHYLLNQFTVGTYAAITGLVAGSLVVVFPGWPTSIGTAILSCLLFIAGFFATTLLSRLEKKKG